jgi:hypothetical protein
MLRDGRASEAHCPAPAKPDFTDLLQLAEDSGEIVGVLLVETTHLQDVLVLLGVPHQLLVAEAASVLCQPVRVPLPDVLRMISSTMKATAGQAGCSSSRCTVVTCWTVLARRHIKDALTTCISSGSKLM